MRKVDINCDLGESFGHYSFGHDLDVMPYISSANIACGFHAADPTVMAETVRAAESQDVAIGAHPGLPDLIGFGRRDMVISAEEAKNYVKYQIGALAAFSSTGKLHHVKPHGALYNKAAKDYELAKAICEGIMEVDSELIVYGLANSQLIKAAHDTGLSYAQEVFADRNYQDDGSLVPRSESNALIVDEGKAAERVILMIEKGRVQTVSGKWIDIKVDSICVHGDNPKAVQFTKQIYTDLNNKGIKVSSELQGN